MDSQRQQKFGKLIQKEIGEIFQQDLQHVLVGNFITITHVRVSPDLGVASVYISMLNAKKPEEVLELIKDQGKTVRHELGRRIRNQARIIPELRFFIDNTAEEAEKMDKLLASLNIPKESK